MVWFGIGMDSKMYSHRSYKMESLKYKTVYAQFKRATQFFILQFSFVAVKPKRIEYILEGNLLQKSVKRPF